MQVRVRTSVALFALAFVAAACGGETVGSTVGTTSSSAAPIVTGPGTSTSSSSVAVPEILEFEAPLLGGGTFRGADYAGKDVAFWFWAPW